MDFDQENQEQPAEESVQPPVIPIYTQPVYEPQTPAFPTDGKGKLWKRLVALSLVAVMVLAGCLITATGVIRYWEAESDRREALLLQAMDERIKVLKEQINKNSHASTGNSVSGTPNQNINGGLTPGQIYAQNVDAVVAISCTVSSGYSYGTSLGSGFVLSPDGYIGTNYHVVGGGTDIKVRTVDGTEYSATFVGGDKIHDIAVIKVDSAELPHVKVGSSDQLIVGDQVVAVGYPLNTHAPVLTVGYVSAKDQLVETESTTIRMLQTDAAINSGNSGGPLFNMKGEVVGITSAKNTGFTSSGATIEGIGFAIPMDDIIGKFNDLMEKGYISGSSLGIYAQNVSKQDAAMYEIPVGVLVVSVNAGGSAEKAGLQAGDIIVNLAGYEIASMSDLSVALWRLEPGATVTVTVYRAALKGEKVLSVTLDKKTQQ